LKRAILIDEKDNVATVTSNIETNESLKILNSDGSIISEIVSLDAIPSGHKISVKKISIGEKVTKYGEIIGFASSDILIGQWVHIHNLTSNIGLEENSQ